MFMYHDSGIHSSQAQQAERIVAVRSIYFGGIEEELEELSSFSSRSRRFWRLAMKASRFFPQLLFRK